MMETLTIVLPEPVRQFVESEVASGKFHGADEYIVSLIQKAQEQKVKKQIDQSLIAALDSGPPRELTDAVWTEISRQAAQRAKGNIQR